MIYMRSIKRDALFFQIMAKGFFWGNSEQARKQSGEGVCITGRSMPVFSAARTMRKGEI